MPSNDEDNDNEKEKPKNFPLFDFSIVRERVLMVAMAVCMLLFALRHLEDCELTSTCVTLLLLLLLIFFIQFTHMTM